MLAECMREHGGFEHNRQSLRVVELLENAYPNFPGLNLTFEVREGLHKTSRVEKYMPSLEAQIADLRTKSPITVTISMTRSISKSSISRNCTTRGLGNLWRGQSGRVIRICANRNYTSSLSATSSIVQVQDVVAMSAEVIASAEIQCADDVRKQSP